VNPPNDDLRDALNATGGDLGDALGAVRGRPPVPPAADPVIVTGSHRSRRNCRYGVV
jgi:hypothetical protein